MRANALAIAAMPGALPPSDHVEDPSQILRVGTIVSVDLATALCVVEIGDPDGEQVETAEIQWGVLRAGDTIVWSPPSVGEQVKLFCPDGDIAQAIPFGALYSDDFPAPGDSLREFVRFKDGAEIGYDPEAHHYDITLPAGATAHIEATGGLSIHGDVSIDGDVTIDGDTQANGTIDATGDITGAGVSLENHTHTGVTAGSGSSGPPA